MNMDPSRISAATAARLNHLAATQPLSREYGEALAQAWIEACSEPDSIEIDPVREQLVATLEAAEQFYRSRSYSPRGGEALAWHAIQDAQQALALHDWRRSMRPGYRAKLH